jgi:protein-tyrosine phosphatase
MILPDANSLVDIHSHLVPGVDDGAKHLPGVLESIERMTHVGIRRVVTTPHIQASLTLDPVRLDERLGVVSRAFETAAEAVKAEFPEVEYKRGHEVLIDVPEPNLTDPRIRMAGTAFVLLEWPRMHVPPGTPRVLRWIRDQGFIPIVAHPERYHDMVTKPDMPQHWIDAGAYLQVNYGSLAGRYGFDAQTVAFDILEGGRASFLSSDFHGQSGLKLYKKEAWAELEERGATESLQVMCRVNPSRLLEGLEPLPVSDLPRSSHILDRIRGMIRRRDIRPARPSR